MANDLAVFEKNSDVSSLIGKIPETIAEKIELANAMNASTKQLSEMVNLEIEITNFVVEKQMLVDGETGEVRNVLRTVLMCTDGNNYSTLAGGIANSVKTFLSVFGPMSDWGGPLKVKVEQYQAGRGKTMRLRVVE